MAFFFIFFLAFCVVFWRYEKKTVPLQREKYSPATVGDVNMEKISFDKKNYRKHSDKNKRMIRKSLKDCGAGRSVLVDADGYLIAGNGVYEQAQQLNIPTRVVETDGSELVVVKRTDLKPEDAKRKELALADNATSDSVEWDMQNIAEDFDISVAEDWGIDFGGDEVDADQYSDEFELENKIKDGNQQIAFMFTDAQVARVKRALSAIVYTNEFAAMDKDGNQNENACAITLLCDMWLKSACENVNEEDFGLLEERVQELKQYLRDALKQSGKTAKYVDTVLGTNGMAGHYFGDSQWEFPTREKYEIMQTFIPLPRGYAECMQIVGKYNYLKNLLNK